VSHEITGLSAMIGSGMVQQLTIVRVSFATGKVNLGDFSHPIRRIATNA
jgi:hypothetical protein